MVTQKQKPYQQQYKSIKWVSDGDYLKIFHNYVVETTWSYIRKLAAMHFTDFEREINVTSKRGGQGQRYRSVLRHFVSAVKEGKIKIPEVCE
jgi:hypothetical protein